MYVKTWLSISSSFILAISDTFMKLSAVLFESYVFTTFTSYIIIYLFVTILALLYFVLNGRYVSVLIILFST